MCKFGTHSRSHTYFLSLSLSDAADKVVQRTGKFEVLVVASHDIAASTAQLVAASRVKARPKSEKLKSLKFSSRNGGCWVRERGRESLCVCVMMMCWFLQCLRLQGKW